LDHTVPWNHGGATAATNLTALCATDHAIKSLGAFRLRHRAEAGFEWTTPSGHRYLRDANGVVHPLKPTARTAVDHEPRPADHAAATSPFPDEPPF